MSDHSTTDFLKDGALKSKDFSPLPRRSHGNANPTGFDPTRSGAPKPPGLSLSEKGSSRKDGSILKPKSFVRMPAPVESKSSKKSHSLSRIKRRVLKHVGILRFLIVLVFLAALAGSLMLFSKFASKFDLPLFYNIAYNFITSPTSQLAQHNGRTNILVMGKAGGTHDGPDLTDTIMFVSVGLTNSDVKIISIPRDMWIPEMRAKINSAYYWGKQKQVGGIAFAKAETAQVVGVPIHYAAVIDFSGFKEFIDELGGIDVVIENSFTDPLYPIEGRENDNCGGRDPKYLCRYETLKFDAGLMHMDGETALKFVRSRHAEGNEGTDIARNARQGKVIEGIKNKLADKKQFLDFKRDTALVKVVLKSIETDIDYPTAAIIARRVYDSKDYIKSNLIPDALITNVEKSPLYDMQSVFIPKSGNGKWQEINAWVQTLIN